MGKNQGGRNIEGLMGIDSAGVVYGLEGPAPSSGLTWTYHAGLVRTIDTTHQGKGFREHRIAGSTLVVTASRDTYVYVTPAGVLSSLAVANNAAKPKADATGIGLHSQFIAKLVSDGSDITSVVNLRENAGADLVVLPAIASFEATAVGTVRISVPFNGRVIAFDGIVSKALAGTDTGTVTPSLVNMNGTATAITNAALTFAISAAIGVRSITIPSAANRFRAGDRISMANAKTTAGGEVMLSIIVERF